jgi:hypothetical protein
MDGKTVITFWVSQSCGFLPHSRHALRGFSRAMIESPDFVLGSEVPDFRNKKKITVFQGSRLQKDPFLYLAYLPAVRRF